MRANSASQPGEVVLEVKGLAADNGITDINLDGARGRDRRPERPGRLRPHARSRAPSSAPTAITAGEIRLARQSRSGGPERVGAQRGIALIPENRKTAGARARPLGAATTSCSRALPAMFPRGRSRPRGRLAPRAPMIEQLRIATPSAAPARRRSCRGGNQQKVVIGKWLNAEAKLFIFDEPTRGIDVGAKAEIFALIDRLVQRRRRRADDQLRAARDRPCLRPRLRDARRPHRRRARARRADRGQHRAAGDAP